jgi:hypothetical protein
MSKPYAVTLPFAGYFNANVDADSEEEAISKAIELCADFSMEATGARKLIDDERGYMECAEWSSYEELVSGNVFYGPMRRATAEADE